MKLVIRPVACGDVEAVMELAVLAWEPVFASFRHILGQEIVPILYPDWRQRQRDAVAQVCADGAAFTVLIAEVDGAVVGFIAYAVDRSDNSPAYMRELLGRSQALLPQCQHVPSGVAVSIEHQ